MTRSRSTSIETAVPEWLARRAVVAFGLVLAVAFFLLSAGRHGLLAAPKVIGEEYPILFSVPVGEDGVTYCCQPRYGPEAIDVAPDGTFWIADSAAHRVLRYDREGRLLGRFATRSAIADLGVSERSVWILDPSWERPALAQYDYSGTLVSLSALPPSMSSRSSHLFVGGERSVQVELSRPPPAAGLSWIDIDPSLLASDSSPSAARNSVGSELAAYDPAPIPAKAVTHRSGRRSGGVEYTLTDGVLSAGRRSVDVRGDLDTADLDRLSKSGLALVHAAYSPKRSDEVPGYFVVRLYDRDLRPRGEHTTPHSEYRVWIGHRFAVSDAGAIYALVPRQDRLEVQVLQTELAPIGPEAAAPPVPVLPVPPVMPPKGERIQAR